MRTSIVRERWSPRSTQKLKLRLDKFAPSLHVLQIAKALPLQAPESRLMPTITPSSSRMNRGLLRTVYQPADAGTGWVNRLTDSTMALRTPTAALDISSTISIRRINPHPAQFSFWRAMESRPRASWLSTSV